MTPAQDLEQQVQQHLRAGILGAILLLGGLGGWAALAQLSSAVIAQGRLMVEGKVKDVQHLDGGVVGQILVRDGDRVEAGQVLLRLDDTQTRTNFAMVEHQIHTLMARQMRLRAERDGAETLTVPADLLARQNDAHVQALLAGEGALFAARRNSLRGEQQQLQKRIQQIDQYRQGLTAQQQAKAVEIRQIDEELRGLEQLYKQQLVTLNRVVSLRRQRTRLQGELAELKAEDARAGSQISEVHLQILQQERSWRTEVLDGLTQIESDLPRLLEQRIASQQQLTQIELRAPQNGIVHQLAVHTVGGVIRAGETVLKLVPDHEILLAEARILPQDIDQIAVGQTARLHFSAFARDATPTIFGTVATVAADLSQDERTGQSYYVVQIRLTAASLADLDGLRLVPGMPVEAFVETAQRSALAYMAKPITDQLRRAFREE